MSRCFKSLCATSFGTHGHRSPHTSSAGQSFDILSRFPRQSRTATFNQTGFASFHLQVNFAYTVEGTGATGTATGAFDCKAPA